jgi:hypothetical protein
VLIRTARWTELVMHPTKCQPAIATASMIEYTSFVFTETKPELGCYVAMHILCVFVPIVSCW